MDPRQIRFGIIGAGPGGLLTAIALKRKGFNHITVYERDQDDTSRLQGYSFSLFSPNGGLSLIEELGLIDELNAFSFESSGFRMLDATNGKILLEFNQESQTDKAGKRVMRSGLRKWLVSVCKREGINIQWNCRVVNYEEQDDIVQVFFENSLREDVDILIGADGIQSPIRQQLVGDELLYTGYTCITGVTHRQDAPELFEHAYFDHAGLLGTSPGRTVFNYHHPPDELFWSLTVAVPKGYFNEKCGEDTSKLKIEVLSRMDGLVPIFTQLLQSGEPTGILELRDRDPVKVNKKTRRAFNSKSGRITLLGDAAHPMVPFRAAGGNNAILDARQLVNDLATLLNKESISSADINSILSKFESEMVIRTTPEVLGSRSAMKAMHSTNSFVIALRNTGMAIGNWKMNTYPKYKSLQLLVKGTTLAVTAAVLYGALNLARKYKTKFF